MLRWKRPYCIREIKDALGVDHCTIYQWIKKGRPKHGHPPLPISDIQDKDSRGYPYRTTAVSLWAIWDWLNSIPCTGRDKRRAEWIARLDKLRMQEYEVDCHDRPGGGTYCRVQNDPNDGPGYWRGSDDTSGGPGCD